MSDQPFTVANTRQEELSPASDDDIMKEWDDDVIKTLNTELRDIREYMVYSLRHSFFCIREDGLLGFYIGGAFEGIVYAVDIATLVKREVDDCCGTDGTLDATTIDYIKTMRDSLSSALSTIDKVLEPTDSK